MMTMMMMMAMTMIYTMMMMMMMMVMMMMVMVMVIFTQPTSQWSYILLVGSDTSYYMVIGRDYDDQRYDLRAYYARRRLRAYYARRYPFICFFLRIGAGAHWPRGPVYLVGEAFGHIMPEDQ